MLSDSSCAAAFGVARSRKMLIVKVGRRDAYSGGLVCSKGGREVGLDTSDESSKLRLGCCRQEESQRRRRRVQIDGGECQKSDKPRPKFSTSRLEDSCILSTGQVSRLFMQDSINYCSQGCTTQKNLQDDSTRELTSSTNSRASASNSSTISSRSHPFLPLQITS